MAHRYSRFREVLAYLGIYCELISASNRDDVIKGVAGTFLTLIAVLSTTWFKERGKYPTRIRSLDEATKIVAFWEGWPSLSHNRLRGFCFCGPLRVLHLWHVLIPQLEDAKSLFDMRYDAVIPATLL